MSSTMVLSLYFGVLLLIPDQNSGKLIDQTEVGSFPELSRFFDLYGDDRIVGGVEAERGKYPFIVSIQLARDMWGQDTKYKHVCGGSILDPSWIITAAHCSTFSTFRYRIVGGAYNLLLPTGTEQIRRAAHIIRNPQYNATTVDYDLALIQVSPPFELNDQVQVVPLPRDPFIPSGLAVTAGWGLLLKNETKTPAILQSIVLPIIPISECRSIYDKLNLEITDRMSCAGIAEGKSVCNGDSGGPLLCHYSENGTLSVLCGLVSWGIPCAIQGYPGVFTNISAFLKFIRNFVHSLS